MTKRNTIYKIVKDVATSCVTRCPVSFSNHPNLLKRVLDDNYSVNLYLLTNQDKQILLNKNLTTGKTFMLIPMIAVLIINYFAYLCNWLSISFQERTNRLKTLQAQSLLIEWSCLKHSKI